MILLKLWNKDDCIIDKTLINSLSDLFLFDYKSQKYGGSGKSFDWNLLNNIKIDKPFFLSGGILIILIILLIKNYYMDLI